MPYIGITAGSLKKTLQNSPDSRKLMERKAVRSACWIHHISSLPAAHPSIGKASGQSIATAHTDHAAVKGEHAACTACRT